MEVKGSREDRCDVCVDQIALDEVAAQSEYVDDWDAHNLPILPRVICYELRDHMITVTPDVKDVVADSSEHLKEVGNTLTYRGAPDHCRSVAEPEFGIGGQVRRELLRIVLVDGVENISYSSAPIHIA